MIFKVSWHGRMDSTFNQHARRLGLGPRLARVDSKIYYAQVIQSASTLAFKMWSPKKTKSETECTSGSTKW